MQALNLGRIFPILCSISQSFYFISRDHSARCKKILEFNISSNRLSLSFITILYYSLVRTQVAASEDPLQVSSSYHGCMPGQKPTGLLNSVQTPANR